MSEKAWSILISVIGMLLVVSIYGTAVYLSEKRHARIDSERLREWKKILSGEFPEAPPSKGSAN